MKLFNSIEILGAVIHAKWLKSHYPFFSSLNPTDLNYCSWADQLDFLSREYFSQTLNKLEPSKTLEQIKSLLNNLIPTLECRLKIIKYLSFCGIPVGEMESVNRLCQNCQSLKRVINPPYCSVNSDYLGRADRCPLFQAKDLYY